MQSHLSKYLFTNNKNLINFIRYEVTYRGIFLNLVIKNIQELVIQISMGQEHVTSTCVVSLLLKYNKLNITYNIPNLRPVPS